MIYSVLFNLPSGNVILSAMGSTSQPLFDELSPLVWWGGGLIAAVGIAILIFNLLHRVFWGK